MSLKKTLQAEAKNLQSMLDSSGLDAAQKRVDRLQEELDALMETEGVPSAGFSPSEQRTRVHHELTEATSERDRLRWANKEAASRLAELDRMLGAEDRAEAARRRLRDAKTNEQAALRRVTDTTAAIEKMSQRLADETGAAEAARARIAASVISSLGDDLGEFADPVASERAAESPGSTPEFHEQRARAIADAVNRAEQAQQVASQQLAHARSAVKDAANQLLIELSYCEELTHAEALAAYLPALVAWRSAHCAAFDAHPVLPQLDQLATDASFEAVQAIREAVASSDLTSDGGLLKRMTKALPWASA